MLGFSRTREWVYPQSIAGRFTTLRRWTFLALHLILFVTPWITVRGHPALLVDLPARRVYLLGQIFTASDTIFLLLLLWFLAFALFFFTAVLGRIWCGYACPQTVFLETWIRPIELWIEGDRVTRKRRDAGGWNLDRIWRKGAKWGVFLAVSLLLAMALMSPFAGARELWTGRAGPIEYTMVFLITAAWFWDFTWFREQFCNYLCPYARFQGALTDDESLTIGYDYDRGEPRAPGSEAAKDGRCIECKKCVVVCPQGIDIRDGFQLECIQCARCIDACQSVMEPLGHETLVRYSSIAEDSGRPVRRWRPRTAVYASLLGGILLAGGVLFVRRVPFEATVNRAPGTLFTVDSDGQIRNTYLLMITNNIPDEEPVSFTVELEGLPEAQLQTSEINLSSTESTTVPLVVRVDPSIDLARTVPLQVRVAARGYTLVLDTTFKTGAGLSAGSD